VSIACKEIAHVNPKKKTSAASDSESTPASESAPASSVLKGFDALDLSAFPGRVESSPSENESEKERTVAIGEGLEAELERLRVNPLDHAGLSPHRFDTPKVAPSLIRAFQRLGDVCFDKKFMDGWKLAPKEEYHDLMDEGRQLIRLAEGPTLMPRSKKEPIWCLAFELDCTPFPALPEGYAYKGGVARKALAQALGLNAYTTMVRDIDVVYVGKRRNRETDQLIGKSLMQDDWLTSTHPERVVEFQSSIRGYMRTREFTVNQVIFMENRVVCSLQALCDMYANCLRITLAHRRRYKGKVGGIVAAKAVRFFVEGNAEGRDIRLDRLDVSQDAPLTTFHAALHFTRAKEQSPALGDAFLDACRERKLLPKHLPKQWEQALRKIHHSA